MEAVYKELRAMQKKAGISVAILLISLIACVIVFMNFGAAGFIPVAIAVIDGFYTVRATKAYTAYFKDNVVKGVLEEVFTDVTFSPKQGLPQDVVYDTGMIQQGNTYQSNDLITGRYNGVAFSQSDVTIEEVTHDSDGDTTTTTLFRGRWMIFDFNKDFRCDMQVISRGFFGSRRKGGLFARKENKLNRVEFENEEFNKGFHVFAQNQEEAFYLMTPHMMEALLKLKGGLRAPIMLMFVGGILHIAVHNNKDAFEAKLFGKLDPAKERERILGDIHVITAFVDEMKLERDIYKHE